MDVTERSQKISRARARRHRASARPVFSAIALVGTMMVLMLLLTFVLLGFVARAGQNNGSTDGVIGNSQYAVRMAGIRVDNTYALNAAEAGVWAAMQWLNEQPSPPATSNPFRPSSVGQFLPDLAAGSKGTTGTWDYFVLDDGSKVQIKIYPYADNATRAQRCYVIEAMGTYKNTIRILRGVASQDTFAKYAFFSNEIPSNYYVAGLTAFNGPVHFNGTPPASNPAQKLNVVYSTSNAKNSDGSYTNAIFRFDDNGSLTCAFGNDKINWLRDSALSSTSNPPVDDEEWKKVAVAGRNSIQLGMNSVDMPTVSARQQDACLNGTAAPSATNTSAWGVTLPSGKDGGIYINGDVDDMVLKAANTGSGSDYKKQIIEVYQTVPNPSGGNRRLRTVITIDPVANTTTVDKAYASTSSTVFAPAPTESLPTLVGVPNGVVYVAGSIGAQNSTVPANANNRGGLSGTIANGIKMNIVTDSTENVNIDGNLTLAYPYAYTDSKGITYAQPTAGILGIVSKDVQIVTRDNYTSTATPTNLSIHATVMAYDSFYAILPDSRATGTLTRLGGTIVSHAGQFGQFALSDLSLLFGFKVNNNYDDRMINNPPPYFPSTGNLYVLVSMERVLSPLQP